MSLQSFKLVQDFVEERNSSAAACVVGYKGKQYGPVAFGTTAFFPGAAEVTSDTIFDIASLTKVVGTTTVALTLLEQGIFQLDTELGELIKDIPQDKARITILHILTHTSGLAAATPLYLNAKEPQDVFRQILDSPLAYEPGTQVVYSCVGYILLGHIIQSLTGTSLADLVSKRLLTILGMKDTYYNPPEEVHPRVAYTEWCPRSKRFLRGIVHDENAQALRGISGNAGLFSTAGDLAKFANMILSDGRSPGGAVLSEATLGLLRRSYTEGLNERRTIGWVLPSKENSSGGNLLSASAIGHTGFTGTSLWIDGEKELFVVLLTNRVHPVRTNEAIFQLRPTFHNAVVRELT